MIDTRLTHERIWQDNIRPHVIDFFDIALATGQIFVEWLNDLLESDSTAELVLGLAILVAIGLIGLLFVMVIYGVS